jgi:hypothetical protein
MTKLTLDISYGMYSSEGNLAVHGIAITAKTLKLEWDQVEQSLRALADSDYDKFGEATDTAVREAVYEVVINGAEVG